jgi:hypothetical protein
LVLKTITISTEDFIKIAARDESHFFDIKEFAVSGKSVQKIAAAFSNADGGEFIIGIRIKVQDSRQAIGGKASKTSSSSTDIYKHCST